MNWTLTLFVFLLSTFASAQTFTLSGRVTEQDSTPIPGASLVVDGAQGSATNVLGRYSITGISAGDHTLVISYLGFARIEQRVSVQEAMDVSVEWNQAQFDTESRLVNEPEPVSELHFTPGTPFFLKGFVSYRF